MSQTHHYAHATTPAGAGTDTVISNAVQIDPSFAFAAGAATGEVSIAQIMVDDPTLAYDFKGLWRWYVIETDCDASDHYAYNGYVGVQEVSRGEGSGSLFPTGRRWSLQLSELNKIADLRVISDTDGDRPDETIAARITWLIGTVYLPVTDNGLITASTLALDKNDYRGQRASDVLNDCALKAQFNWWIYYDQSAAAGDEVSLAFFDPNDTTMYRSDLTISNVAADINGTTCFAASDDSKVSRDPQKIAAGVYLPYTGGAVYDFDYDTSYEFMFQDQVAPTATIKTSAKASVLATQFLEANDEQDEQITTTIQLPSSLLNIVKHGQLVGIKLSHVPGYEDFRNCRVTRKTFGYTDARSQKWYDVSLELSPVPGEPSGAAAAQVVAFPTRASRCCRGRRRPATCSSRSCSPAATRRSSPPRSAPWTIRPCRLRHRRRRPSRHCRRPPGLSLRRRQPTTAPRTSAARAASARTRGRSTGPPASARRA